MSEAPKRDHHRKSSKVKPTDARSEHIRACREHLLDLHRAAVLAVGIMVAGSAVAKEAPKPKCDASAYAKTRPM